MAGDGFFLGWSVDVDDIYRKTNRRNKGTEFDLSLYSSKLGVDIFYRRTGNNYKIHKINGFPEDIPRQLLRELQRNKGRYQRTEPILYL